MDRRNVRLPAAALVAAAAAVGTALGTEAAAGQGSSVSTQSACSSARAGAAVAAPCRDASSVFYNPAALARGARPGGAIHGGGVAS